MAFRLKRVARLHEQLRRLRQLEVEAESNALASCREALVAQRRRHGAALEEERARAEKGGGISASELQLRRAYADALLALEERLRDAETAQAGALEASRARLRLQRTQERRFSHLEERWREREVATEAERAQRAVDELALRRAGRKA